MVLVVMLAGVAAVLLAVAAALELITPAPLSFSEVSWTVDYVEDAVTYGLNPLEAVRVRERGA